MSKSPSHIFLPLLGGTALVLGVAYGVTSRDYGAARIETLETNVETLSTRASAASDLASAEAARVAELELKIAEVQAAASERAATGANLTARAPVADEAFGIGRPAQVEEVAAWDVDVLPDGRGLPEGSGDVLTGEEVFVDRCGSCHGDFAEGVDNWPVLAGGFDTLADKDPVKTFGSYWPYLSTAWDYISRSMPFGEAGTLTPDETYAIVAYLLYSNDLVDDDFVLSNENFSEVNMYNMEGFVIDDRPELEYSKWRTEPCMENCKDEVQVTMRSVFLVNTPPEGGSESVMNNAKVEDLPSFTANGPSFVPQEASVPVDNAGAATVAQEDEADDGAVMIAEGEKVFKKCKACHQVGANAANKTGPHLNGIYGRTIGGVESFKYSRPFQEAAAEGRVWDEAAMAAFLTKPKEYFEGTKMSFSGLKKPADIEAIAAFLRSVEE